MFLGRQWDDPETQREINRMPNKASYSKNEQDGGVQVKVTHDGNELVLDTTSLLAMQLGGLKRTSERTLAENKEVGTSAILVKDVVLSVPAYYTEQQRRQVLDAAKIAELNVLSLMNESTAVALDYGMWKNARNVFDAEKKTIAMFVDVGYADASVTIVTYVKGKFQVLACAYDRELGGRNIDEALVEKFAAEFQAKTKLNVRTDSKAMLKLKNTAEKAKQVLTPEGMTKAELSVEYLMNETDYRSFLTIEDLDAIVQPIADRLKPVIERAMLEAGIKSPSEVSVVEVIGGSMRMRQFKKVVANAMGLDSSKAPNFGVLTTLNGDESVARGCSLMCAILSPQFRVAVNIDIAELINYPIRIDWEQPANKEQEKMVADDSEEHGADGTFR
jgi:heat shock protein 4